LNDWLTDYTVTEMLAFMIQTYRYLELKNIFKTRIEQNNISNPETGTVFYDDELHEIQDS